MLQMHNNMAFSCYIVKKLANTIICKTKNAIILNKTGLSLLKLMESNYKKGVCKNSRANK